MAYRLKGIEKYEEIEPREKLTNDSIIAITVLEDDIIEKMSIIELLRNGRLIAIYKGDNTKPYDIDKFIIKIKDEKV